MLIQRKRVFSLMLALLLSLTVQRPALAALDPSDAGAVTVREWAAMLLCTFGDDEETRADQDCLVEAYRRGWLSLSGVLAPDAALCRGALYESAFAAGDLPVYDWSLYPGGAPLSGYENCLRIGAELGLCPSGADPLEIVTRSEAAALLHALQAQDLEVMEPPMLSWLSIQNDAGADLNDYLLELQSVPGPILERFRVEGWTFVVDTRHLAELGRKYRVSCTGATEPGEKRIYVASPSAVLHEFGHFLDYVLDYPSKSEGLYEEEAEAAAVFLRDYALTGEREYFAEYFACYLRAGNDMERAAEMERLTPQTYGWFAALEKNGWGCEVS